MPSDLKLMMSVAQEAGEIASRYWKNDPKSWDKGGTHGPVSEADLHTDRHLRDTLMKARPDYGWLSEETEDDQSRLARDRAFIVDPIDGTRAFLAGKKSWAISIAMIEHGTAKAGVVVLPKLGLVYAAEAGLGATLNGQTIAASKFDTIENADVLVSRPVLSPKLWPGGVPPFQHHFRPSLAYRIALVAEGRFDGMITLRPTWEWDVAAGFIIANEAGAVTTDKRGLTPRFNNKMPQIDGAVIANPGLHADLLKRLDPTMTLS